MALSAEQRSWLEEAGVDVVRIKLQNYAATGSGGLIGLSPVRQILRSDIEAWLAEKTRAEDKRQQRILHWAIAAAIAGIVAAVLTAVGLFR
jgi:hypothetical protein